MWHCTAPEVTDLLAWTKERSGIEGGGMGGAASRGLRGEGNVYRKLQTLILQTTVYEKRSIKTTTKLTYALSQNHNPEYFTTVGYRIILSSFRNATLVSHQLFLKI